MKQTEEEKPTGDTGTEMTPAAAPTGDATSELEQLRAEVARLREREQAVAAMFAADPRSGEFIRNWRDGSDPVVELIRQFGPELRLALDDPELQQSLAEANSEYLARVAREQQLTEEFSANIARSLEMIDEKGSRENIDDAELEAAWEWLRTITDEGIRGIVSEQAIDMALKAINHDRDVSEADRTGEVRGRNTAIEAHVRTRTAGDGTVTTAGSGRPRHRNRNLPPLGFIDAMDRFRSVWD
ncbi:MAG: hypothetical protein NC336_06575 [Clostridium sp.]|nr:hypothetical protein [Clostridium sp.]